jgi:hypothetical protein
MTDVSIENLIDRRSSVTHRTHSRPLITLGKQSRLHSFDRSVSTLGSIVELEKQEEAFTVQDVRPNRTLIAVEKR